jgi:hypothetical protein
MVSVQFLLRRGGLLGTLKKISKLAWDFGIPGFHLGLATMVIEKSYFSIRYLEKMMGRISNV